MKCNRQHRPSRQVSSKTLSKLNLQNVQKDNINVNTFESETNRLIRSRLTSGSMYLHDQMVYKNMKLTSMVADLSTFTNCLDDTKWIFGESYRLIKELLVETAQFYQENTIKRLRIDSIGREYINLKKRFDQIDMHQIKRIVASYMQDNASVMRTPLQELSIPKQRKSSLTINASMKSLPKKQQREHSGQHHGQIQELQNLKEKIVQLETINHQHLHINKQMKMQLAQHTQKQMQIKKQLSQLMHLTTTSMENELSTIDKVKTILKKLRETNGQIIERDHHLQLIDSLVVNLSTLQRRLREQIESLNLQQRDIDIGELQTKRQLIRSEISSLQLEMVNLRDERQIVEGYINQLQTSSQHREQKNEYQGDALNKTKKSIRQHNQSHDTEMLVFLTVQAESIEKLLSQ